MTDDGLNVLLFGGGVAAASVLAWGTARPPVWSSPSLETNSTWIYPVPTLDDRPAVISNPFAADKHLGADIMFRRRDARDLISVYPPRSTMRRS